MDEAHATEIVAAWRASKLTCRALADDHGIDPQRLSRWAKQLSSPTFAEVFIVDEPARSNAALIIELGQARVTTTSTMSISFGCSAWWVGMLSLPPTVRVFFALDAVDLRKGFDGLSNMARSVLVEDPLSGISSCSSTADAIA